MLVDPRALNLAKLLAMTQVEILSVEIVEENPSLPQRLLLQKDISEVITNFREKLKTTKVTDPYFKDCFQPFCKMQLTALHLCAMVDHLEFATFLVKEMKVDIAPPDLRGWTPLHHARAHRHHQVAEYLFRHMTKVQRQLQTRFSATAEDLTRFLSKDRGVGKKSVMLQQKKEDALVSITGAEFEEITGIQYSRVMKMSFDTLMERWLYDGDDNRFSTQAPYLEFYRHFEELYRQYRPDPTALYIERGKRALFVAKPIKAHQCIVPFIGTVAEERGFRVLIEQMGNEAALITPGFPNTYCVQIRNHGGLGRLNVAVASEDLCVGDQLCYESSMDDKRFDRVYDNPRQEAMEAYFKENDPVGLFKAKQKEFQTKKGKQTEQDLLTQEEWKAKLMYFYRNPGAIVSLFLKRIIDIETLCNCTPKADVNILKFKLSRGRKDYLSLAVTLNINSNAQYFEELEGLLALLRNVHRKFESHAKLFDVVAKFVLEKMQEIEICYVLYFLELIEGTYFERLQKEPTKTIEEVWRIVFLRRNINRLLREGCLDETGWEKLRVIKRELPFATQQHIYEKLIGHIAGSTNIPLNMLAMKTFEPEDTQSEKTDT